MKVICPYVPRTRSDISQLFSFWIYFWISANTLFFRQHFVFPHLCGLCVHFGDITWKINSRAKLRPKNVHSQLFCDSTPIHNPVAELTSLHIFCCSCLPVCPNLARFERSVSWSNSSAGSAAEALARCWWWTNTCPWVVSRRRLRPASEGTPLSIITITDSADLVALMTKLSLWFSDSRIRIIGCPTGVNLSARTWCLGLDLRASFTLRIRSVVCTCVLFYQSMGTKRRNQPIISSALPQNRWQRKSSDDYFFGQWVSITGSSLFLSSGGAFKTLPAVVFLIDVSGRWRF